MTTSPRRPWPAPKRISARPAASASLSRTTLQPVCLASRARPSVPIQLLSMLAAVSATPSRMTDGSVQPKRSWPAKWWTISPTTPATAAGVAGCGVAMRSRSAASLPVASSTGAPLMPVPPMSMPSITAGFVVAVILAASAEPDLAIDAMAETDGIDGQDHAGGEDGMGIEASAVERTAHALLDLALGGHAHRLEELAQLDVEGLFVHRSLQSAGSVRRHQLAAVRGQSADQPV